MASHGRATVSVATTLLVVLGLLGSCGLPRDPQRTTQEVRNGVMRVGVSENPPWVERGPADEPQGLEPDLVRIFADELDADIEWSWDDPSTQLEALAQYQLHLVIAGLTDDTPWAQHVALTNPYYTEEITIGLGESTELPKALDGLKVHVARDHPWVALVEERGAIAVPVAHPLEAGPPVIAARWELAAHGLSPSDLIVARERHVMAVGPGENGILTLLETFLGDQSDTIAARLRDIAASRGEEVP